MRTSLFFTAFISFLFCLGCSDNSVSPEQGDKFQAFRTDMRVLWSDHALWTRNVIINIVDGLPGTTEAVNRLLQNQVDIGNAIKPHAGIAAGDTLTALLTEHIVVAADLLTAAKANDTEAFQTAHDKWYANGEEIAAFLAAVDPEQDHPHDWSSMMKTHLDLTLEEAVARLTADYAADVIAYDKVYAELMEMSDMISSCILDAFPEKF